MPRTKFQEVIFTIMMVIVMVYAMVVYNISLDKGGLTNEVFLIAFGELVIMGIVGFILEMLVAGPLAQNLAFAGPLVRFIFAHIFPEKLNEKEFEIGEVRTEK